ncbi:MAG: SCO family protein [Rhizobiales bacterium]|nr:SCO family protein [Rhizobacter sp.]
MPIRRTLFIAAALGVALAGCDKLGLASKAPAESFRGADITGADYARSLSLPDANGQPRTLGDFKGKVTVVFFGYTQCPDVCPTTMVELAQVKKALGADGDKLQAVFITVDPERDTPEILRSYMASFDPSFVALRGTLEQTQATAKEFKVYFQKVPGKTEGNYTMDHSAGAFVLDTKGNVRLFERYGAGAEGLTADIKALLAQG